MQGWLALQDDHVYELMIGGSSSLTVRVFHCSPQSVSGHHWAAFIYDHSREQYQWNDGFTTLQAAACKATAVVVALWQAEPGL